MVPTCIMVQSPCGPTILLSRAAEAAWLNARLCNGEIIHKNEIGGVALQQVVGPEIEWPTGADAPAKGTTSLECLEQALWALGCDSYSLSNERRQRSYEEACETCPKENVFYALVLAAYENINSHKK